MAQRDSKGRGENTRALQQVCGPYHSLWPPECFSSPFTYWGCLRFFQGLCLSGTLTLQPVYSKCFHFKSLGCPPPRPPTHAAKMSDTKPSNTAFRPTKKGSKTVSATLPVKHHVEHGVSSQCLLFPCTHKVTTTNSSHISKSPSYSCQSNSYLFRSFYIILEFSL